MFCFFGYTTPPPPIQNTCGQTRAPAAEEMHLRPKPKALAAEQRHLRLKTSSCGHTKAPAAEPKNLRRNSTRHDVIICVCMFFCWWAFLLRRRQPTNHSTPLRFPLQHPTRRLRRQSNNKIKPPQLAWCTSWHITTRVTHTPHTPAVKSFTK